MVSAARTRAIVRRLPILLLAIAMMAMGAMVAFHTPAAAQEQQQARPWSLRDLLFPRKSQRVEPPAVQAPAPKKRSIPRKPAEPQIPIVEKTPDARVILVVGDFMASGLAEGLNTAFAENPGVRIVDRSNGSSGFVRDDHYNWPKQIKTLIDAEKPAAVVIMMGSNDRQQMKIGDVREAPGSENWTKEYEARTAAFGKVVETSKVPFLWVGMPAFKASKMTSDMLAFNDIYRSAAEDSSGEFIDVWDGFVDENGVFITTGPDINGQPVRLRGDDGINLSRAGKRKLAFYTEKPLMKILGLSTPSAAVASAPAGAPVEVPGPDASPVVVDRSPPMLLSDPALDGGVELMGATPPTPHDMKLAVEKLAVEGIAVAASPGRADDFSWPPKPQPSTTAATDDKTTAINP